MWAGRGAAPRALLELPVLTVRTSWTNLAQDQRNHCLIHQDSIRRMFVCAVHTNPKPFLQKTAPNLVHDHPRRRQQPPGNSFFSTTLLPTSAFCLSSRGDAARIRTEGKGATPTYPLLRMSKHPQYVPLSFVQCFSSRSPSDAEEDEQRKRASSQPPTAKPPNAPIAMEKDFAAFLKGGSSLHDDPFRLVVAERRDSRKIRMALDVDKEKEMFKQIRTAQINQKEQSRIKTAANVYRALVGNVIICVGGWKSIFEVPISKVVQCV
jgi:hypothetical protein